MLALKIRTADLDSPGDENEGNNYVIQNDDFTNLKMKGFNS